ncbi:tRNA (5-methylaminomethyl-2-thiouridine)(34)-methyltransferase MnmD [Rhizobium sp. 32-5/1]|uniref:tRNA (5-methylaminomethyl-2-thiouridine)(34)-methyltransferase MnmD n=1 Tax=Rhizobium sp. 32-5/1 TaxID=3019602 RepID=UPI00240E1755|nr:tRNA (5-methylaminomethyl-2-thiouridine)(34)-methyltransferase MnmD [Rhizobium sp. 32-5/1]WEZ82860.1 tRNA (5-methylaminomethyl-2-thiouridine)(34)-methyltransferase MnmD [Rhizobium sp. 32-5/1]
MIDTENSASPECQKPERHTLEWHEGDMPYSAEFGDHFYCREDGRLECDHVFLGGNDVIARWQNATDFNIGELGFGTGLNFCETWRQWKQVPRDGQHLHFISFERFPMKANEIDRALSRWPEINDERNALCAAWSMEPAGNVTIEFSSDVRLTVVIGTAETQLTSFAPIFDAWYLDGFAPLRNPDMWSLDLMRSVFDRTNPGGSFATYAAAGFVRRNLQAAGFAVERRKGFGAKREMLCGIKQPI